MLKEPANEQTQTKHVGVNALYMGRNGKFFLLRSYAWLVLAVVGWGKVGAQPVLLPPLYADCHIVETLMNGWQPAEKRIEILHQISATTNVMPLEWGSRSRLPDLHFAGGKAYYRMTWYTQVAIASGKYRLLCTRGIVQEYTGSPGAAQLFLDAQGRGVQYFRYYDVDAYMNNSEVTSWTLEQSTPLRTKRGEGVLQVGVSLLDVHRIQQGNLRGNMLYWHFEGDLSLDTTRGLPPERESAWGAAAHLAVILPIAERERVGLWAENPLGIIWQRTVQQIRALVQTNTVIPDADGFLHAAPFLSGSVQEIRRTFRVQPRYTVGLFLPFKEQGIILLAQQGANRTYQVGYAKGGTRFFCILPEGIYTIEWRTGAWRFQAGTSSLRWDKARHAFLTIQWVSPLGE